MKLLTYPKQPLLLSAPRVLSQEEIARWLRNWSKTYGTGRF